MFVLIVIIMYIVPVHTVGKTLLVKAVANQTSATFLRVCGSELIQKYLVRTVYVRGDIKLAEVPVD